MMKRKHGIGPCGMIVRRDAWKVLCMIILVVHVHCSWAQQKDHFTVNHKKVNINTFNGEVAALMEQVGVPGMSLAIIDHNQVVFTASYGYKGHMEKTKVDSKTVFEAASLSKSFLAFVAHKMVNEGKLDLDKPMCQYKALDVLQYDARNKLITPRMALGHATGLENWRWYNNPDSLEFLSAPGESYIYSGEGYHYLASVIETLVGKPYQDYMEALVYAPLGLKNTFSAFNAEGTWPDNFASGHSSFGKEITKQKNVDMWPASGIHTTAEDYARLIVSFFNKNYLSRATVKDMLNPVVQLDDRNPYVHYAAGFVVQQTAADTIIYQNGSNRGYRAGLMYSVVSQRGLVFLTNSERGNVLGQRLSELTVGLDIDPFYGSDYLTNQYPSATCTLLHTYVHGGENKMFARLEALKADGAVDAKALNELGYLFFQENPAIAQKILEYNVGRYPESPAAIYLLGCLNMQLKDYRKAYDYFMLAKEKKFVDDLVDLDIADCKKKLAESKPNE